MRFVFLFMALFCSSVVAKAEFYAVDGDSLENGTRRIRLEGIDAPEYKQYCFTSKGEKYLCGQDSLKYLQNLMDGKDVRCQCENKPDRYKRELCICFAGSTELNRQMVAAGQAVSYLSDRYKAEEKAAQAQKLGIWQGKFMRPALYRVLKREKEQKWCKSNPEKCKLQKERKKEYKKALLLKK